MEWSAPSPLEYFAALVAEEDGFPLTEAAAAIAQSDDPALDLEAVLSRIDRLASNLKGRIATDASAVHRVRILHRFLYEEMGFAGNVNDYYQPANSYLHEVLRTRQGIPISLGVLYLELAGRIGLKAGGVSFPGHFLIKLHLPQGDAVIDPLNGQSLTREALDERIEPFVGERRRLAGSGARGLTSLLITATPREILTRMLRNLAHIHGEADDTLRLLCVLDRLVILQPGDWAWRRDRGLARAELGHTVAAIEDLATYLVGAPGAPDREEVRRRLEALRAAGPTRWH